MQDNKLYLCMHGATNKPRKETKKHDTLKGKTLQAMDDIQNSPRSEDLDTPPTQKVRYYPAKESYGTYTTKYPPGQIRYAMANLARPYMIIHIYDNGFVDVIALQG